MTNDPLELRLYRLLARLQSLLGQARDAEQALHAALRATFEFFQASRAALAELEPNGRSARLVFVLPADREWDLELLARFLRRERPLIPEGLLLAPLYRRGRLWRVLAIRGDLLAIHRTALARIARTLSDRLGQIDSERIAEVRSRIDRKILEELRPKDLFYQILHGLRTLTGYDHSSALLIAGEAGRSLELVAEQIAWRKGKSRRIGLRLGLSPAHEEWFQGGEVYGFELHEDGWKDWGGRDAIAIASLLDYNTKDEDSGSGARERRMLCAPLVTRDGLLGVLKVASRHPGGLGRYEAELVRNFLPQVSFAIRNSRRAENLEAKVLAAERKHAMANLARSVAHDVNNALGAVLPLVQQIRDDLAQEQLVPKVLAEDLQEIERSLRVCRRIFGGMLVFARGAARGPGTGHIARAIDNALAILRDGMERRRIRCEIAVAEDLPATRGRQSDLEQLFFNLLANARDAMPEGGRLAVRARVADGNVEVRIEDTGVGIPEDRLELIEEPFFTTKPEGTGLGLAICRSIVWEIRGDLEICSPQGEGTCVRVVLPVAQAEQAAQASQASQA